MAAWTALSGSTPALCISLAAREFGNSPVICWASLPTLEPCASMPTASITESGPRPSVTSRIAPTRSPS
jgi:hypothetical protein